MSIQAEYSFFLKTADGHRGAELTDITGFNATFRWNEITKWTMNGAGLTPCPLEKGSAVIVYRGESPLLSGYVTQIEDSYDAATGIYDWSIQGEDDLGLLARRAVYPDPAKVFTAQTAKEYTATGPLGDIVLELIRRNITATADLQERQIPTITTESPAHMGPDITEAASFDDLEKLVLDRFKDSALGIRAAWNGQSGKTEIQLYQPRDVSQTVVFSVEAGSLAGWRRTRTAPKANVILAKGAEITNAQGNGTGIYQRVQVEDAESVAAWGRIEAYIEHSDITPIEETDAQGNVISRESWESVLERLTAAAYQDLEENAAQDGYELTPVILDRMEYKTHWDIGDTVSVRIADVEFKAPIKEIQAQYSGGIETITPSVGELQKGELQTVFDSLGRLKAEIKVIQKGGRK